jgi:hypothetical protein
MKIAKKHLDALAAQFEGSMDCVTRFDSVPYHVKREAAELAAKTVVEYLEGLPR